MEAVLSQYPSNNGDILFFILPFGLHLIYKQLNNWLNYIDDKELKNIALNDICMSVNTLEHAVLQVMLGKDMSDLKSRLDQLSEDLFTGGLRHIIMTSYVILRYLTILSVTLRCLISLSNLRFIALRQHSPNKFLNLEIFRKLIYSKFLNK